MIHSIIRFTIVIFGILLLMSSCNITKQTVSTDSENEKDQIAQIVEGCNAVVRIKNYTHEPGCQYLFELSDGTLLLPGELPETNVPFYERAGAKIGYEILDKDETVKAQSPCNSHDYIVRITCIEEHVILDEGLPYKHEDCKTIKNPYKFEWMRNAITEYKPTRVNEYDYTIGFIYEFKTSTGSILFDCLGNLMCNTSESEDCKSILETLKKPKVILVVNN